MSVTKLGRRAEVACFAHKLYSQHLALRLAPNRILTDAERKRKINEWGEVQSIQAEIRIF